MDHTGGGGPFRSIQVKCAVREGITIKYPFKAKKTQKGHFHVSDKQQRKMVSIRIFSFFFWHGHS